MLRKIILILFPIVFLTIVFIILVAVVNKRSGKGALQITSLPNSSVYLDGKYIGKTPLCKCDLPDMLESGTYNIKLDIGKAELQPFEQKITISPNVLTAVDRTFEENGASSGSIVSLTPLNDKKDLELLVISFPNKAQVYVDNNLSGSTPISIKNITPSDHDVELTKDGYKDKTIKIRTVQGYRLEALVFMGIDNSILENNSPSNTSPKVKILQTPTGFLRVREASDSASVEIAQVNPGDELELLQEVDQWFQVKLANGKSGWISSQYAQKSN